MKQENSREREKKDIYKCGRNPDLVPNFIVSLVFFLIVCLMLYVYPTPSVRFKFSPFLLIVVGYTKENYKYRVLIPKRINLNSGNV